MRIFCPICGSPTEALFKGKCKECALKSTKAISLPGRIEIGICKECLRYKKKGRWIGLGDDIRSVLKKASSDAIKKYPILIKGASTEIKVENIRQIKNSYEVSCKVFIKGKVFGVENLWAEFVKINACLEICDICSKKKSGYYEAILQVRGKEAEGVKNKIELLIASQAKKDKKSYVLRTQVLREGVDYYIGSARIARKVASSLRAEYKGTIKESRKLIGMNDGKRIYRTTILLRLKR